MNLFRCIAGMILVVLAGMTVLPAAQAQEPPYGVTDQGRLDALLKDAKAHLVLHEDDLNWLKTAGIASHQLASLKVEGASEEAVRFLKHASELEPDNAGLLAYLGSAYAMAGRDSSFVVKKVSNVNKGLAELDKAVKKAPNDMNLRFIRASVAWNVPPMFARRDSAASDFQLYVNASEAGRQQDPVRLAEANFRLGQIAEENQRTEQARNFYRQAQKAAPGSTWAQQAGRALK